MKVLLNRERLGGVVLVIIGFVATYVAITSYPVGTLKRMGPGMFPAGLGILLAALGCLQYVLAMNQRKSSVEIRIYSPLFVLGGIATFASSIGAFGLVPAITGAVVISSAAERRLRIFDTFLLVAGLSLLAPFIFRVCLGLPITLFEWPF